MASPKPTALPLPKRTLTPRYDTSGQQRKPPKRKSGDGLTWPVRLGLIAIVSLGCFGGGAASLGEQAGWGFAILILLIGAYGIFLFDRFKIQERVGPFLLLIVMLPFVALGAVIRWFKRLFFKERTEFALNIGGAFHERIDVSVSPLQEKLSCR